MPGAPTSAKSSLLNALTGRKAIARASVTPGRTQELNFFEVGEPTLLRLVDMPGYGFAKAPLKVVENWKRLVRDFLRGRVVLKRTLLLIDARHGPKPVDAEMMQMLDEAAVGYRIVLTKADKIKASELAASLAATVAEARKHSAAYPEVLVTSAEKGMGIAELRAAVFDGFADLGCQAPRRQRVIQRQPRPRPVRRHQLAIARQGDERRAHVRPAKGDIGAIGLGCFVEFDQSAPRRKHADPARDQAGHADIAACLHSQRIEALIARRPADELAARQAKAKAPWPVRRAPGSARPTAARSRSRWHRASGHRARGRCHWR